MKKFVVRALLVVVVLVVAGALYQAPSESANAVEGFFALIGDASEALVTFVSELSES